MLTISNYLKKYRQLQYIIFFKAKALLKIMSVYLLSNFSIDLQTYATTASTTPPVSSNIVGSGEQIDVSGLTPEQIEALNKMAESQAQAAEYSAKMLNE